MPVKLANAFSLNMVPADLPARLRLEELRLQDVRRIQDLESHIGHESTCYLLSSLLGRPIELQRSTLCMSPGEMIIVAQYSGPRLPEGATSLPEGASIRFVAVTLEPNHLEAPND